MAFKHIFTLAALCALGVTASTAATVPIKRRLTDPEKGVIQRFPSSFAITPYATAKDQYQKHVQGLVEFLVAPERLTTDSGFKEAITKLYHIGIYLTTLPGGSNRSLSLALELFAALLGNPPYASDLLEVAHDVFLFRARVRQNRFNQALATAGS